MDPLIEPDTAVARSNPTLLARDGYYPLAQGSLTVRLNISSEAPICHGYAAVLTPTQSFSIHLSALGMPVPDYPVASARPWQVELPILPGLISSKPSW